MAAFRPAVEEWGSDMLEMDVRATRDGRVVVIHDPTVDRTCDGTGEVAELPWSVVRGLDAGHHFRDEVGAYSFRGRGVSIPLFEEVLEAFPATRLNVEAKSADAAPGLVEIIRRHGAQERVLVAAEKESNRSFVRGYQGPWGASKMQIRRFWISQRLLPLNLYTPAADVLQVPEKWEGFTVVTPRFVERAHARNIPVHVWTVDDPDDMRRLLSWGVDGIQTDRPDILGRVLSEVAGRPRSLRAFPREGEVP